MIVSAMIFVLPYGLSAISLVVSGIGIIGGVPYTVAEDEYTIRWQSNSFITWRRYKVAATLFS